MAAATRARAGGMGDRRGTVALEVALLFPIAVILLVGFAEMYFYVRAVAIVERVAAATADMVAKRVTLNDCVWTNDSAHLGTHLMAAETMAAPLRLTNGGMVVLSGINDPGTGTTVAWQRRSSYRLTDVASTVGAEGNSPTLPAGLTVKQTVGTQADTLIVAEIAYRFVPFAGIRALLPDLPGEITILRRAFVRGRWGTIGTLGQVAGCTGLANP